MNSYKVTFFIGLLIILFVLFVYDNPKHSSDKRTEIKILVNTKAETAAAFQEILDDFEKENPDLRVTWIRSPGKYYVKVQTMMVGKTCADVLIFSGKRVSAFSSKNTLLNLMPYIKRDQYNLDDFFPVGLADAQMTEDELYYMPMEGSGTILYYNKDLFDEIGLKYPDDSWTWETFLQAAQDLTIDYDGDGHNDQVGLSAGMWWAGIIPWIWSNGGDLVNKEQTKCLLNEPEALEAMQFLIDLVNKYHVTNKSLMGGGDTGNVFESFASGRIGMFSSLAYSIPNLSRACEGRDLNWDIALPPKGKHGRPIRYTSSGFVIWKESKVPDESWRLLKYLMRLDVMERFCTVNEWIPARKSLVLKESFLNNKETPYDENVLLKSLQQSRPLDNVYALRSIARDFSVFFDRAKLGMSTLDIEMNNLVARANEALNEAQQELKREKK